MGPGRLTGMNGLSGRGGSSCTRPCFNGARSIDRDERHAPTVPRHIAVSASMGPGRLTGMNVAGKCQCGYMDAMLQWGPVD